MKLINCPECGKLLSPRFPVHTCNRKLIDETSPLYLKRLVRELNAQTDGFYAPVATFALRCNRARLRNGAIECHSLSASPAWFTPARNEFTDAYSRSICASRKP